MQLLNRSLPVRSRLALAAALTCTALSIVLSGCGNSSFIPSAGSGPLTVAGHAQGGEMPVVNGTVTLYATAANATGSSNGIYTGGQATILGQTTTNSAGNFTITGATACAAPDQMYIVISGGSADLGADTNSNILLTALAGSCPTANSFTSVNEITTIATAYALSSFTTIAPTCTSNGYTASPCVNITSDITNYDGLYTAGAYAGTGSSAAGMGLMHAVANANNLATMTTGAANSTTTTGTGTVPATEINTLANIMQVCVNSAGGAAVANSTSSPVANPTATTAPTTTTQSKSTITGFPSNSTGIDGTLSIALNGGTPVTGTFSGITSVQGFVNAFNANANLSSAVANVTTTTLTVGTGIAASTFDITGFTPTSGLTGTLTLTLGGTSTGAQTISGTTPANIVSAINSNPVFSAQPSIVFSTPTASSSSSFSTSTLTGIGPNNGLNGNIYITVGSTAHGPYTISGTTSAATFITAFNQAVPSSIAVASANGAAVLITGATKASGFTLSFPSNTLVSTTGVVSAALSGTTAIVVTSPTGTLNIISAVSSSLTGTAGPGTFVAASAGPTSVSFTGPSGSNAVTFPGTSLNTTPAYVGDGSHCGALFTATPSVAGAVPTNTLQAILNLAKNPYSSPSNMTAIFGQSPGTGAAFSPSLSASPADWTMAITYNNANTGIFYPYWLATDANDDMYLVNTLELFNSADDGGFTNILALSSNGTLISPSGGWTTSVSSTDLSPRGIAPDALGNLWVADNAAYTLNEFNTSTGALTASYERSPNRPGGLWGVAVDRSNNVWLTYIYTSNGNIDELTYSGGTSPGGTYTYATGGTNTNGALEQAATAAYNLAIDQNQNVWSAGWLSGNTVSTVINQTPSSTPTYTANTGIINTSLSSSVVQPYGIAIDSSGNAWTDLDTGVALEEVIPTFTGGVITGATAGSPINSLTMVTPQGMVIDGNNTLWIADIGSGAEGLLAYNTVTHTDLSPATGFKGCFINGTACGTTAVESAIYEPKLPAIDSTGSVWAAVSPMGSVNSTLGQDQPDYTDPSGTDWGTYTAGGVTEIIGTAAPAWPLRATGKPGVMP